MPEQWGSTDEHSPLVQQWGNTDDYAPRPIQPDPVHEVLGGIWDMVPSPVQAAKKYIIDPWSDLAHAAVNRDAAGAFKAIQRLNPVQAMGEDAGQAMIGQGQKAIDEAKAGNYSEAAGHAIAAAIPFVGPAAADIGEAWGKGEITDQRAFGRAIALIGSIVGPEALQKTGEVAAAGAKAAAGAATPEVAGAVGGFAGTVAGHAVAGWPGAWAGRQIGRAVARSLTKGAKGAAAEAPEAAAAVEAPIPDQAAAPVPEAQPQAPSAPPPVPPPPVPQAAATTSAAAAVTPAPVPQNLQPNTATSAASLPPIGATIEYPAPNLALGKTTWLTGKVVEHRANPISGMGGELVPIVEGGWPADAWRYPAPQTAPISQAAASPAPAPSAAPSVPIEQQVRDYVAQQQAAQPASAPVAAPIPAVDAATMKLRRDIAVGQKANYDQLVKTNPAAAALIDKFAEDVKAADAAKAQAAPPTAAAPTTAQPQLPPTSATRGPLRPPLASVATTPTNAGQLMQPAEAVTPEPPASPPTTAGDLMQQAAPQSGPKLMTEEGARQYAADNGIAEDDARRILARNGVKILDRGQINRGLHYQGIGHSALSDSAGLSYGVKSMKDLTDEQMLDTYIDLLGKRSEAGSQGAALAAPDLESQLQASIDQAKAKSQTPANAGGLMQEQAAPAKPQPLAVKETPDAAEARQERGSEIVNIDPAAFGKAFEQSRGEPLAWSEARAKALESAPSVGEHPYVTATGMNDGVDVIDGRHRIAEAARRGQASFPVQVNPEGGGLPKSVLAPDDKATAGDLMQQAKQASEAPAPALAEAYAAWNEQRAYIDGKGNYHLRAEGKSSGPIAPWNKAAKAAYRNVSEFHAAAKAAEAKP
jgi:hypothetical protein